MSYYTDNPDPEAYQSSPSPLSSHMVPVANAYTFQELRRLLRDRLGFSLGKTRSQIRKAQKRGIIRIIPGPGPRFELTDEGVKQRDILEKVLDHMAKNAKVTEEPEHVDG